MWPIQHNLPRAGTLCTWNVRSSSTSRYFRCSQSIHQVGDASESTSYSNTENRETIPSGPPVQSSAFRILLTPRPLQHEGRSDNPSVLPALTNLVDSVSDSIDRADDISVQDVFGAQMSQRQCYRHREEEHGRHPRHSLRVHHQVGDLRDPVCC